MKLKPKTMLGSPPQLSRNDLEHINFHSDMKKDAGTGTGKLKDRNVPHEIKWKLIDKAQPFSPVSGICALCTVEKYYIMFKPELAEINKRDEINNYCPHKISALLENTNPLGIG